MSKERVIHFLKHDRSLSGAKRLYSKLPNRSLAVQSSLTRMRDTTENLRSVCYQLCRSVGIKESQMKALLQSKVQPAPETVVEKENKTIPIGEGVSPLATRLLDFDPEKAEWPDVQSLASDLAEDQGEKPEGRTKEDLLAFIQAGKEQIIKEKIASEVPDLVKKSIKLRDQFPFLKKPDCPDILKVLVSDLMTAYDNYTEGRKQLFDKMSIEEEAVLAHDIVENFISNKQAFEELEHYQKTGQILGNHPIFEKIAFREEFEKKSAADLTKKSNALRKNISTNKTKAEKAENDDAKADYTAKVELYTWQEEIIKELLKNK